VKFLCYEGTMQAKCMRLMGKKLLVALAMEGKFAGEGLQTLDEDDDMLTSMAKELVEKNGIGESADSVWRQLNAEHQRLFPTRDDSECPVDVPADADAQEPAAPPHSMEAVLGSPPVLVFGQKPEELRGTRRRPRTPSPEQGLLFNWN
jgi:hypothetical protein